MKTLIIDNRFVLGRSSRTENLYSYLKNRLGQVDVYCRNRKFAEDRDIHKISSLSLGIYTLGKLGLHHLAERMAANRFKLLDVNIKWALNAAVHGIVSLGRGDMLISSSPDECNHLAALIIKSIRKDVLWISDWRDPWTDNKFPFRYRPSNYIANFNNQRLEKIILKYSDVVWANTDFVRDLYISKYNLNEDKIQTVRNGYKKMSLANPDRQVVLKNATHEKDAVKIFFFGAPRPHEGLPWAEVLDFLSSVNKNSKTCLELHYFANKNSVDHSKFDFVKRHPKTSYEKGMETMAKEAAMCLVIMPTGEKIYNGIVPQKIYDYLQLKLPVLFIGSLDAEAAKILNFTNSGFTLDVNNLKAEDFQLALEKAKTLSYEHTDHFDFEQIFSNAFSKINGKLGMTIS